MIVKHELSLRHLSIAEISLIAYCCNQAQDNVNPMRSTHFRLHRCPTLAARPPVVYPFVELDPSNGQPTFDDPFFSLSGHYIKVARNI